MIFKYSYGRGKLKSDNRPLILFWTTYYKSYSIWHNKHFNASQCQPFDCLLTHDRTQLETSDVVVFGIGDLFENDLPQYRNENQLWIAFTREPPLKVKYENPTDLKIFKHVFNLTSTYRTDSDIPYAYGHVISRRKDVEVPVQYPWSLKFSEVNENFKNELNPPLWNFEKALSKLPARKGNVLWLVSNCKSKIRMSYATTLSRYIHLDILGGCGSGTQPEGFEILPETYKFYLAFENSNCKDYITEKLYKMFEHDIIPIVAGGGDYEIAAPPKSYIHVDDYNDPRDLANYLHYLNKNHSAFMEYMVWKRDFYSPKLYLFPCRFCEALKKPWAKKSYEDLHEFFEGKAECRGWRTKPNSKRLQ